MDVATFIAKFNLVHTGISKNLMKKHKCTPHPVDFFDRTIYQCSCGKYFNDIDGAKMFCRMLGRNIKLLRLCYNWTQRKLAAELNISIQRIRIVENGEGNLTLKTIENIAEAFGLSGQAIIYMTYRGLPMWRTTVESSISSLQRKEKL